MFDVDLELSDLVLEGCEVDEGCLVFLAHYGEVDLRALF